MPTVAKKLSVAEYMRSSAEETDLQSRNEFGDVVGCRALVRANGEPGEVGERVRRVFGGQGDLEEGAHPVQVESAEVAPTDTHAP